MYLFAAPCLIFRFMAMNVRFSSKSSIFFDLNVLILAMSKHFVSTSNRITIMYRACVDNTAGFNAAVIFAEIHLHSTCVI